MTQGTDIELGGAGYQLAPGRYKRTAEEAATAPRGGRLQITGFAGGQRHPVADPAARGEAAARGWDGIGVGPVYGGAGVEPWPDESRFGDSMADLPSLAVPTAGLIVGNACYVGLGRRLYRSVPLTAPGWGAFTVAADLGPGIAVSGLARYKDDLLLLCGSATPIRRYNTATGLLANPWIAGERGVVGVGYRGQVLFGTGLANDNFALRLSLDKFDGTVQFRTRYADAPIVNLGLFAGKVVVATRQSLFLFGGDWDPGTTTLPADWRGELEPVFSHGAWTAEDDFVFLLGYGGRLYTWLAGGVVEWAAGGLSAGGGSGGGSGWRRTGPVGRRCLGGCVAAGLLVVAVEPRDGGSESWAFDGAGWWRLQAAPPAGPIRCWPVALGGAGNRDLLLFRAGSTDYDLCRLVWRSPALHAYSDRGEWVSSLLDAGARDSAKRWRAVGADFAAPEGRGNPAGSAPLTLALDYSLDAGRSWSTAVATSISDPPTRTRHLTAALPNAASRWLQLRVRWEGVTDWAPTLVGLWAEHEAVAPAAADAPPKRRRWLLTVVARDGQVRRDGALQPRDGRQLAADLWTAWRADAPLPFRDLDHDATGRTDQVRIAAIAEDLPQPADAGRWGDSLVSLTLVDA